MQSNAEAENDITACRFSLTLLMHYRQLGNSGLRISAIGFGCMSLNNDQPENNLLIHRAIGMGINFFDTADLYEKGENERRVGLAIKEKRKEIILATKVGNQWRHDGSGWDWNPSKEHILSSVEQSLRRLGTDYIDLYQLHGGTIDDPMDESIEAFELLKQQGKIRHYGISSIRPNVIREYVKRSSITSVMMQYSLLDRRPEEESLALLHQRNIGVLTRGSLAQGLLAGKPAKAYLGYQPDEVNAAARAVATLSNDERTAAQTAIQFALHHPSVSAAVIGIRSMEQLEEVAAAVDTPQLTDADIRLLQASITPNRYTDHR